jgi:hypothetical protein
VVFDESREQKIRALLSQLSGVEGVQIQEDKRSRFRFPTISTPAV